MGGIIETAMDKAKAAFAEGTDASDPTARAEAAETELAKLKDGLAELGYPENGGPEDATTVDKALMALRGVTKDRDDATARAEAAEKKGAKGKVAREPAPTKPRSVGPMGDGEALSGTELRDAIADADKIEIAFSDGKQEIGAAEPVVVEGEVWREHTLGLMLKDPVTVKGPTSPPGFSIDGYALLLDGKQVAYCSRPDKLNVAPGQTVSLSDDIFF